MPGIQDIIAALAAWSVDLSPLIGVFESRDLEFKMTAYQLGTAAGKAEFAKDVGGMANAGGGLIVLGIETERDPATGRDRSSKVRPIRNGIISIPQIEDVARTWLYPPQRRLEVREWPGGSDEMLASILVPPHDDPSGLVLCLGPGDPPDRNTIGVPVRSESRVDFHTAPEVYDWIRRGRLLTEIAPREGAAAPVEDADRQMDRVRSEYLDADPEGLAFFVLQAWTATATRIDRMHDRDGVRGMFLEPPSQRSAGFGWWGLSPEVDVEGGVRVSSGRLALWITPAGIATLVVTQDYLTWAMERYSVSRDGPLINSIALGEFAYEFARMYSLLVEWAQPRPSGAWFRACLFRAREPLPLQLGYGRADQVNYMFQLRRPVQDEPCDTLGPIPLDTPHAPEWIAARVLRAVYAMFGLGREAIPHLVDEGERFDPATLSREKNE